VSLFVELKRRNIFRVAIAYIIVAWLTLQVSDTLGPALNLPEWIHSGVAFVLILGFPIAMVFAWAYELTPDGLKKESEIDRNRSITSITGRKLDYSIISLLAVALIYFVWEARFQSENNVLSDVAAVPEIATEESEQAVARLSIAVLPFENRSNREEDQFFTDGIHDDLLTTIAKIGSMKVISRTSVMQYRNTTKEISQIATELGVANILEGGIQRSGKQVRINIQLIDAATDTHLWAEVYDRELTAENLFAIQSEISKAIADALQATLSPEEVQRIDTVRTDNLLALEAYLRGRQLMATRDAESLNVAVGHFNEAVALDPQFALAWVGVADSNRLLAFYGGLAEEDYFAIRKNAIERALEIDDKLGEAYTSLGSLYADQGENELAEAAYKQAIQLNPNYATAWQWYSGLQGRDPARRSNLIELLGNALELDPLSSIIRLNLANAYVASGQYSMAEPQYLQMIDLDPGFGLGLRTLAYFYMNEMGRFDQAMVYALKAQELESGQVRNLYVQANIYLNLGDLEAAESVRNRMRDLDADHLGLGYIDIEINLFNNNSAGARDVIRSLLTRVADNPGRTFDMGFYSLALGDNTLAREIFESSSSDWLDIDQSNESSSSIIDTCIFSWALISTGDVELGRQLLQQSIAVLDGTLRAANEHVDTHKPEICYLASGDTEKALETIEKQVDHNHLGDWYVYHMLPMYDSIRDESRYKAALQVRERRVAPQRAAIKQMNAQAEL